MLRHDSPPLAPSYPACSPQRVCSPLRPLRVLCDLGDLCVYPRSLSPKSVLCFHTVAHSSDHPTKDGHPEECNASFASRMVFRDDEGRIHLQSHQNRPFIFMLLHTLPFSVSRNPCVCHSYENNRGGYQLFPKWNIPAPAGKELT